MKYAAVVVWLTLTVISTGCSYYAGYTVELSEVRGPSPADDSHGVSVVHENKVECSNDVFTVEWGFDYSSVNLSFVNNRDATVKIIWDECVFVDPKGNSHHIIPSEVLYSHYYESIKPSKIPGQCGLNVSLIPRDNIRYTSDGWRELAFLPQKSVWNKDGFLERVESYIGKNIQVLLAMECESMTYEYRYIFDITDAGIIKRSATKQVQGEYSKEGSGTPR